MEAEGDQVWICKAAKVEKLYEMSHKKGTFLLAYQLSLSSVEPLQEVHVRHALTHLHRKCPNLRVCFGYREDVTWFRHRTNQDIDFQVVAGIEAEEVRDLLQTYQYNSETGPLWCVRLLLNTKDNIYTIDKEFPHTSQLFLGMHHSITDGITTMKICGCLISLINDVIDGKPIDDEEQIGDFISDMETDRLVLSKMSEIQKDPNLMQELSVAAMDKGLGMPFLLSTIPAPVGGNDNTHNLTHVLDKTTTKRFITKCKTEGITVHSAFTALINASIVNVLVGKENIRDSYRLCNGHVINLRRYWAGDVSQVLGCHAHFPVNLWAQVPRDIIKNFWDFARYLHQDIHHHLKEETALLRSAYQGLNTKEEPSFNDIFHSSTPMQVDVSTSNLGDVTAVVTEGGPHVRPYLVIRQISLHYTDISNFANLFHTFRGRLILNLMYNTKFVTTDLAQKYCSNIFSLMEELLKNSLS